MLERMKEANTMQKHLYEHFDLPGDTNFLEDVTVTLIDKTVSRNPT